ncbi:MAG: glycosyltransferase family 4 protein [Clostridiales bacterium]|nr:glycosyltransferase family 4 protein [Clostridiales bacterium]
MNIAVDLTSLDDNFTGIERYALNMTLELIKGSRTLSGSEVTVSEVTGSDTFELIFKNQIFPDFKPYKNQENIHIHILPGCKKLLFNQWRLPRYLNRLKADYYLFFAFPMPILLRKKHVLSTIHDMGCWDCPETMKTPMVWYFRLSYRWAVRHAERTITVSEFSKSRIQQILHVPEEKILVTYNGVCGKFLTEESEPPLYAPAKYVDDSSVGSAAGPVVTCNTDTTGLHDDESAEQLCIRLRQKYHLPDEYILCLSTLEPRKNMTLLLNAYLDLYRQGSIKTKLVLAGRKGWKIDELLREAGAAEPVNSSENASGATDATGISEATEASGTADATDATDAIPVTVTGFVDDGDLPEVYRMAKYFVFPSIYEGFGIPPLEAMSQGVPVISSDAASMLEVLGEAPLYFRSGDEEDLKRAILAMESLTEAERADRAAAGLRQSQKFRYGQEAMKVRKYLHSCDGIERTDSGRKRQDGK